MSLPSGQAALTPTDHGINRLYTFGSAMVLTTTAFVVVVLFQSVFWAPHIPLTLKAGLCLICLLSVWRPHDGLLAVAALTPFGLMLASRVFSANPGRITEAIAVSFLAGYVIRHVVARFVGHSNGQPQRAGVPAKIAVPAILFCMVTLASCIVHYGFVQAWQDHPASFFERFVRFLLVDYHADRGNYDPVASDAGFRFAAFGFFNIQCIVLFLITCDLCLKTPALVPRLIRMVIVSIVGASILSFVALGQAAFTRPDLLEALPELLHSRWTMFTPKLNTAASLFVLAIPLAIGAAAKAGRRGFGWVAAATVILGALWINGTRVALIALALVLVANVIWHFMHQNKSLRYRARPVLIGITILAIGITGIVLQRAYTARAIPVSESLGYRYEFNKTALLMFASRPIFGVGIDQFYLQSETFGSPDLPDVYRRVPAHNPFLQHAGELGITGVIAFSWLLGSALWLGFLALRKKPTDKYFLGIYTGLVAFLLTTASSGHPLLIEVTAYTFWIVLGLGVAYSYATQPSNAATEPDQKLSPALHPSTSAPQWAKRVVVVSTILLAISIPLRWSDGRSNIDFADVSYGLHNWEEAGGMRYRWTSDRATLFFDKDTHSIELPLRAPFINATGPIHVDVLLDGRLATRLDLNRPDWQSLELELPPTTGLYRELELQVSPSWFPQELLPGSTDPRELGVMVGELERQSR